MSTYSPELRIELITNGTQAGVWGDTTNRNLGSVIEQAISGYQSITTTVEKYALVTENGQVDEARNAILSINTTFGAAFQIFAPPSSKSYTVTNVSAYNATFYNSTATGNTTAAGLGVLVEAGKTIQIYTNGTSFYSAGTVGSVSNTPNTLVQRDASGNFAAGTISATTFTGSLTGNVTGNATGSSSSLATTNWTVVESGGSLYFKYNTVNKMKLDSSGNITVVGNVTAYGTIT